MPVAAKRQTVDTTPFKGQKMGTSGLRKKTKEFSQPHYLANWLQALFTTLKEVEGDKFPGCTLVVGGDGRFWSNEAFQIVVRVAFGNGVGKLIVGQNTLVCTPAMSAAIRKLGALGGIIMTASHNPGGENEDFGIKYNGSAGQAAPEKVSDIIFARTEDIKQYEELVPEAPVDVSKLGSTEIEGGHTVDVIDTTSIYLDLMKEVFDFPALKEFCAKNPVVLDGLNGVAGVAASVAAKELGLPDSSLRGCTPLPDFGGGHPDPNLVYAKALVDVMFKDDAPMLGVAFDGDGDRNMILGRNFFVTPSDSVAIIAAYAEQAIPYFQKNGLKGVARSMPTSTAVDKVAEKRGLKAYEVPTGWKFFCNLMDDGRINICGEESFGTGSDHVREKDGLWAALAWMSILAFRNKDAAAPVSVAQVVEEFWKEFGRSLYVRYDYEGIVPATDGDKNPADTMMENLTAMVKDNGLKGKKHGDFEVSGSDIFEYNDPVDGSVSKNQGIRIFLTCGSRIVFRLSGTGSSGATVRLYMERLRTGDTVDVKEDAKEAVKGLATMALDLSQLQQLTGRNEPTVIT